MRYFGITFLALALAATWAWAGVNLETGALQGSKPSSIASTNDILSTSVVRSSAPVLSITPTRPEATGDVKSLGFESLGRELQKRDGQGRNDPPRILWGPDVLIEGGSHYRVSVDCFHNSPWNAYAAVQESRSSGRDSVLMYRTTDQGVTWQYWDYVQNPAGLTKSKIMCYDGVAPDTSWVLIFILETDGGAGDLWVRFRTPDLSAFRWSNIVSGSADSVQDFDAALQNHPGFNVPNGAILVTFSKKWVGSDTSYEVYGIRSINKGATWVDRQWLYQQTYVPSQAKITHGNGNWVYVNFLDRRNSSGGNTQVRSKVSTDLGVTWLGSVQVSNYSTAYNAIENQVASGPGDSLVWAVHGFNHPTAYKQVINQYSADNGATWSSHAVVRNSNNNEEFPSLKCLRGGYSGAATVNFASLSFNAGPTSLTGDTTWSGNSSGQWPGVFSVNPVGDHNASTSAGPAAGFLVVGSTWNVLTAYSGFGPTDVWADYGSIVTGVEAETPIVKRTSSGVSLSQNVPNPFGKGTRIAFSLPKSGSVDLAVYDIAGRKVATLAQGTMPAGSHEVSWDGAKAPAGVYLYRLSFEGKTLTNRMIVVR